MKDKSPKKQVSENSFGTMKFDSIKIWVSKNGNTFYMLKFGKNTCFVSEKLLSVIKKQAA